MFLTSTIDVLCSDIRSHRSLHIEGLTYIYEKIVCNKDDGSVVITSIDERLPSLVRPSVGEQLSQLFSDGRKPSLRFIVIYILLYRTIFYHCCRVYSFFFLNTINIVDNEVVIKSFCEKKKIMVIIQHKIIA